MVSLSAFRQNSAAIEQGEWVSPGEEFGDFEILTRGFTDAYFDLRAALERSAARQMNKRVDQLPSAAQRAITVECVQKRLVLGVRNLVHDEGDRKGEPVTLEEFRTLLENPDLPDLTVAVLNAAGKVGKSRENDVKEAVGNLSRPSGGTSAGGEKSLPGSPE